MFKKLYFDAFKQEITGNLLKVSFDMHYNKKKHFNFVYDIKKEEFINTDSSFFYSVNGTIAKNDYEVSCSSNRYIMQIFFNCIPIFAIPLIDLPKDIEQEINDYTIQNRDKLEEYVEKMEASREEKKTYFAMFNNYKVDRITKVLHELNNEYYIVINGINIKITEESKPLLQKLLIHTNSEREEKELLQEIMKFKLPKGYLMWSNEENKHIYITVEEWEQKYNKVK